MENYMEFQAFPKIKQMREIKCQITQKLHGTNAQVCIYRDENGSLNQIRAGSRTRWIFPGDDNYGFAAFIESKKEELIEILGEGTHYGEWVGPGINSGEGLTQKTFVLFDWWRYRDPETKEIIRVLPDQVTVVPLLYDGPFYPGVVEEVMNNLKTEGSKLVPGFMRPEGVVVRINNAMYKQVFQAEETQWRQGSKHKSEKLPDIDYTYLCQPLRIEKLLSKDERYLKEYPQSLHLIVKDYVRDLEEEGQIVGDEDQRRAIKKGASSLIYKFAKHHAELLANSVGR
jgi:hypothetical protein